MRQALRVAVIACGAMFVLSLVLVNTVFREDGPEALWWVFVPFGLFFCGTVAVVGSLALLGTRRSRTS